MPDTLGPIRVMMVIDITEQNGNVMRDVRVNGLCVCVCVCVCVYVFQFEIRGCTHISGMQSTSHNF